jgi:hypothetical protein
MYFCSHIQTNTKHPLGFRFERRFPTHQVGCFDRSFGLISLLRTCLFTQIFFESTPFLWLINRINVVQELHTSIMPFRISTQNRFPS